MTISRIACALAACAALLCGCRRGLDAPLPHVEQLNRLAGATRDLAIELREGTNMAAAPSPDGKRIVFSMQGALWVMPLEGGNAQRITGWELEAAWPVWSPDGATIAFQNYGAGGNYHIWTITPEGRRATELTGGPWDDREPAWLPDGSGLVFASDRGNDGQYKIWRLALDDMALTQLTQGKGAESEPALAPDGKRLAWTDNARIYTLALATAGAAPVAVASGSAPAWMPDSGALAYRNLAGQLTLAQREVSASEDVFPFPVRFLADGRMLYTADGKIRLRQPDGRDPVDLAFEATMLVRRPGPARARERGFGNRMPRRVMGISAPALAPDGERIAFVALNDVWVMTPGEAPQRLTNDRDRDAGVQWTADGSAVYFSSERANGGRFAIDQVVLATRARTRLAALPGVSMGSPRISPSGAHIAYLDADGQLALYDVAAASSTPIAHGDGAVSAPSWSADGRHVMVVANERVNSRYPEGYNKLRVSDLGGGRQRYYAVGPAPRQVSERDEGAAVLAPDGRQVAFIMDSVLHVMPVNPDASPAGPARQLGTETADLPSWSGDGRTILYKAADKLKLVAAAGGPAREVALPLSWTQAAPTGTLLIRAGALWDGVSPKLARDVDILVTGNRIAWIRPHQDGAETAAARFIDASQLTVLPGLWDSSVHPGSRFAPAAAAMLASGITSALSAGGPLHQGIELREALEAGNLLGPRLFAASALLGGNRVTEPHARSLRTLAVADLEIAKARRMGVDFMAAGGRAPVALMNRIAQGALALGVQSGAAPAAPALIAGIGGAAPLASGQRLGYDWSRSALMGIGYQDAHTLYANGELRLVDSMAGAGAPAALRRDAQQQALVLAAGALVSNGAAGPPAPPGMGLHLNLRAAGMAMTRHQALQTVTINAARHARVEQDLGSVEAGKLADLVAVRGNPLQDLAAAANVAYVIKNGTPFTPAQILAPLRMPPDEVPD